jgi:phage terminase large subunit-like protein
MLSPKEFVSSHLKKLHQYISDVTGNTICVGKYERLAVARFIALKSKYTYKESEVNKVFKFISLIQLPLNNVVQQYIIQPHECFWIANIYGLWRDEDNRLFDLTYISIAKGNNKSTFASILSIYEAIGKGTINSHILLVAGSREQASTLIKYVGTIVTNSPLLSDYFVINKNVIYNRTSQGINKIEIRASDSDKIHSIGAGMTLSVIDEFAVHKNAELQSIIKSAQESKQRNHHQLIITHANTNKLVSPAYQLQEICENILEGKVQNDNIFTQIFALDSKEEIENPEMWRKANPMLGVSVPLENLLRAYDMSKLLKEKLYTFITFNLNTWSDNNIQQEVWIPDEKIVEIMGEVNISNQKTYYGVDLSKNRDLNSICELAQTPNGDFEAKLYNIFPNNESVKIRDAGSIDLSRWFINEDNPNGFIHRCNLEVLDEDMVIDFFKQFQQNNKVQSVGFDPMFATQIAFKLDSKLGLPVHYIRQNWSLTPAISLLERLIYLKKIKIERNPVVRWMFQNTSLYVSPSNGNMHLTKKNKEAIDGVIAIVVALATWLKDNENSLDAALDSLLKEVRKSA